MPRYSEGMKKAWAKKSPEERSARARALARKRWGITHKKHNMAKITLTNDDGSTVDFVDPSGVAAAVAAAAENGTPVKITEVKVEESDGSEVVTTPDATV